MKKCWWMILVCCVPACASQEAYRAYTDAVVRVNAYRVQPGIEQRFDEHGRLIAQKITLPDQPIPVQQIKDSEWAAPASMALSLGVMGLSNWAITKELAGAVKATQPNVTTNTSSGGHMAGGNLDASTSTSTQADIAVQVHDPGGAE
ncbi:MAG: hypothetical protein AB1457_16355 [Chloroflexota bacterium]